MSHGLVTLLRASHLPSEKRLSRDSISGIETTRERSHAAASLTGKQTTGDLSRDQGSVLTCGVSHSLGARVGTQLSPAASPQLLCHPQASHVGARTERQDPAGPELGASADVTPRHLHNDLASVLGLQ